MPKPEKNDRYKQDETGQWWYYGRLRRLRVKSGTCPQCSEVYVTLTLKRVDQCCSTKCGLLRNYAAHPGARAREKSPRWKGGRFSNGKGYMLVATPAGHPYVKSQVMLEHRLVMEMVLGRYLIPGENVHHKNGVKDDNRPENLELWVTHQPSGQRKNEQKHCETCTCN